MKWIKTILIILVCLKLNAQNTWLQRASFSGTARQGLSSFEINNKIYIVGGWDFTNFYNELWEFDPATNIWTQKTSLPAPGRRSGIAFAIGNKGYYGTGDNGTSFSNYLNDFWEYDPTLDTWTQKANFGGLARGGAISFVQNGNAYVGTGTGALTTYFQDMWMYNPSLNTWTQKANFGGTGRRYASAFTIGAKAYVGTGQGATGHGNTFYEYDYLSDTWTQKAGYPAGVSTAVGYSINGKGYILTGYNGTTYQQTAFEYNPIANSWTQKANFGGGIRGIATGIAVNGKGYVCAGYGAGLHNDIWEYTQSIPAAPVANFSIPSLNICQGTCINITDLSTNSPDYYTWDLMGAATPGSTIQNPAGICYNTLGTYTISQIVSNSLGADTSIKVINVVAPPSLTVTASSGTICAGKTATLNASGAISYTWTPTALTSASIVVTPTTTTIYTLTGRGSFNCTSTKTLSIFVNPKPIISISGTTSVCINSSLTFTANGSSTYTWNTGANAQVITVTPTVNTNYTVTGTNSNNCTNTKTVSALVNNACQYVWPGDANSDGTADNLDVLELGLHYTLTGPSRSATNNNWQSYFANNWTGTITNGKNLNHSDCNGDGIINDDDTLAIYNNYGLSHVFKPAQTTTVSPQLSIIPDQASVVKGAWGTASIYLGDATTNINNINGVAFTVDFDNTLIETNSIYIEYQNSFLVAGQNLDFRKLDFPSGKIYTATTHTINNNVSGFGKIATLHYQIKSSLTTDEVLSFGLSQVNQSDASGTITPLTSGTGTLMAIGASVGLQELNGNNISVSPNPTNGSLIIHSKTELQKIEVVSITGQVLLSEIPTNTSHTLHLENFANGIYFVNVYQNNHIVKREKVILNK